MQKDALGPRAVPHDGKTPQPGAAPHVTADTGGAVTVGAAGAAATGAADAVNAGIDFGRTLTTWAAAIWYVPGRLAARAVADDLEPARMAEARDHGDGHPPQARHDLDAGREVQVARISRPRPQIPKTPTPAAAQARRPPGPDADGR